MALIPEDRLRQGVIAAHSVLSNITLSVLDRLSTRSFVSTGKAKAVTDSQIDGLRIKTASRDAAVCGQRLRTTRPRSGSMAIE